MTQQFDEQSIAFWMGQVDRSVRELTESVRVLQTEVGNLKGENRVRSSGFGALAGTIMAAIVSFLGHYVGGN